MSRAFHYMCCAHLLSWAEFDRLSADSCSLYNNSQAAKSIAPPQCQTKNE